MFKIRQTELIIAEIAIPIYRKVAHGEDATLAG